MNDDSRSRTVIDTPRLRLFRLAAEDAPLMLAIWNDPKFIRHVFDRGIRTVEQAQEALAAGALRMYEEFGFGPFGLALRSNNEPVGICGLFRREGLDDTDIGYAVLPDYRGLGYAREAAVAVIEYARDSLGLQRLTAIVSPNNVASINLTEQLGFRYERTIRMPGSDDVVSIYARRLRD